LSIRLQWDKLPDLPERLHAGILIGSQHRDHRPPFVCQRCQEFSRHTLTIYHNAFEVSHPSRLLVVSKDGRQSQCQMLISSMGGNKQGVTLLIMQDHQSATAQDFSRAPD
jgi:hypothetical protein